MGGLAGGRVRSICKRGIPKKRSRNRNTAVPGSRVIQAQGEFRFKGLVKHDGSWVGKMKIA